MAKLTRRWRRAGGVALAALTLALPAAAQAAACPAQPVAQRFLPWADPGWYAAVPDGGFEGPAASWTLAGGTAVVAGNEPYFVGTPLDQSSLALPSGASATSAGMCTGLGHPTLRFFARNLGSPHATLTVSAVIRDPNGAEQTVPIGVITAGAEWAPTPPVPVASNVLSPLCTQSTAFRFAPADNRGRWSIDDVYLDPYGKG
jgi:hypothetical protein